MSASSGRVEFRATVADAILGVLITEEAVVQVLQLRNGWSFLRLCSSTQERADMLGWLVRFAWWQAGKRAGPLVRTLSIGGLEFTLDWAAAEHVAVREILARGEYWPTREFRPRAGEVVVDVGANAGVFAIVAGRWIGPTGRLLAIEPNPAVANRLRRNLRQNGLEKWSSVVAVGLSDHIGTGRLFVGRNTTIGTLMPEAGSPVSAIDIDLDTLDHLVGEFGIPTIDLLKIDVEGLELRTLDGALGVLQSCRRLVLEVSRPTDIPGVMERCDSAGFDDIATKPAGVDSGATIVFARRTGRPVPRSE